MNKIFITNQTLNKMNTEKYAVQFGRPRMESFLLKEKSQYSFVRKINSLGVVKRYFVLDFLQTEFYYKKTSESKILKKYSISSIEKINKNPFTQCQSKYQYKFQVLFEKNYLILHCKELETYNN